MAFAKKKSSCIGCKAVLDDDSMYYENFYNDPKFSDRLLRANSIDPDKTDIG